MMLKMMEENHLSKYRSLDIEQAQIRSFSLLSKKLVRKKLALVLGSIFYTLGLCLGAGWTVFAW